MGRSHRDYKREVEDIVARVGDINPSQITKEVTRVIDQAAERAAQNAGKAKDRVSHAVSSKQAPAEDALAQAREIAHLAAARAVELMHASQERASSAANTVQSDLLPKAAKSIDRMEKQVERTASQAGETFDRARESSRHAAGVTVETGKRTGAFLFWMALLGGIVYFILLNKNRRERAMEAGQEIVREIREVVRDLQGYDREFS